MLGVLGRCLGCPLLAAVWTLAMVGVGLKHLGRPLILLYPTTLYVILGWLILNCDKPLVAALWQPMITSYGAW